MQSEMVDTFKRWNWRETKLVVTVNVMNVYIMADSEQWKKL